MANRFPTQIEKVLIGNLVRELAEQLRVQNSHDELPGNSLMNVLPTQQRLQAVSDNTTKLKSFLGLPKDIWRLILQNLGIRNTAALTAVCKEAYHCVHPLMEEHRRNFIKSVFVSVAHSNEPDEIERFICKIPGVLVDRVTVQDPKGREIIDRTLLQIAAAGMDPKLAQKIWDLFVDNRILRALGKSSVEMEKLRQEQYSIQFPKVPNLECEYDFSPLIQAFINASDVEVQNLLDCNGILEGFQVNNKSPTAIDLVRVITQIRQDFPEDRVPGTGFFFPYGASVKVYELYEEKSKDWGRWNSPKKKAFAHLILGWFDRITDARRADLMLSNLYDVVVLGEKPQRSLSHRENYFSKCRVSNQGLGFQGNAPGWGPSFFAGESLPARNMRRFFSDSAQSIANLPSTSKPLPEYHEKIVGMTINM